MAQASAPKRYVVRHVDGSTTGPVSKDVLRTLVANGTVVPDDELAREGTDQWMPAWKAKGLFPADRLVGYGAPVKQGTGLDFHAAGVAESTLANETLKAELQRTAALVRGGLITQRDYDEKKRRLLGLESSSTSPAQGPAYELIEASQEPQYWYMLGGDVTGPNSMGVLVGRAATGIILPSTPIGTSPNGPWTLAKGVLALRAHLRDLETPTGDTLTTRRTGTALLLVPLGGILISCVLQGLGIGDSAIPVMGLVLVVLLTSLLVWWDASVVGISDRASKGKRQTSAGGWAVGTMLLWAVCYPAYMYWRGRTGARQLLGPAIAVAILFVSAPFITAEMFPPLPAVDSYAVTSTFAKVLRESAGTKQLIEAGMVDGELLNPTQVSFDPWEQRRIGRGQVRTPLGLETVTFSVSWRNRRRMEFWVVVNPQAGEDLDPSEAPPQYATKEPVIPPSPVPPAPKTYSAEEVEQAHSGRIGQIDNAVLKRLGAGHAVLEKPLEFSKQVLLGDKATDTATNLDTAFVVRYRVVASIGDNTTGHGVQSVLVHVDILVTPTFTQKALVAKSSDFSGFDEMSELLASAKRLAKSEFDLARAGGRAKASDIDRLQNALQRELDWSEFTTQFAGGVVGLVEDMKALQ